MNLKKPLSVAMIGSLMAGMMVVPAASVHAEEVIKIGWLAPLTGTAAENGQQVTWAAEMIVDLINEEHADVNMLLAADAGLPNLDGAKIELVEADTKGDTTVATSEARRPRVLSVASTTYHFLSMDLALGI